MIDFRRKLSWFRPNYDEWLEYRGFIVTLQHAASGQGSGSGSHFFSPSSVFYRTLRHGTVKYWVVRYRLWSSSTTLYSNLLYRFPNQGFGFRFLTLLSRKTLRLHLNSATVFFKAFLIKTTLSFAKTRYNQYQREILWAKGLILTAFELIMRNYFQKSLQWIWILIFVNYFPCLNVQYF
jgi:hypothetical protein